MVRPQNLTPSNSEEAARHRDSAQSLAASVPPVFRQAALAQRRWLCVGVEDELEGGAADRLAEACSANGYTEGWSVKIPWNPEQQAVDASQLTLTSPAIQTLTKDACLGSCYLLVEQSERFAIASDGDLYWMLAGNRTFVETVVGTTVERQLETFSKLARAYKQPPSLAGMRLSAVQTAAATAYQNHARAP